MNTSRLDHTDLRMLIHLQEDSRISNKQLASKMHMSLTTVSERIRRLSKEGYIKGYTTELNREKFNLGMTVFIHVQLWDHSANCLDDFNNTVSSWDEVRECYHMSGQYDFYLKIVIMDMPAYSRFLTTKLAKLPNLAHLQSYFVIAETKFDTRLKLDIQQL
ncbi:Lrp/AsnC family transcriptional regulator [Pedobacter sp. GR22-6]|uniref:Lrp/AsnC family transcriptional regulator n=1 Tax=Pedobacter sp. GR22-6 TaxID=3127957 RepID=UPI00307CCEA4